MSGIKAFTISVRLSRDEKTVVEQMADKAGVTESELLRRLLFPQEKDPDVLRLVAAEVRGMRNILFPLVLATLKKEPLTEQKIREIVQSADSTKYDRADESILSLVTAKKKEIK